MSFSSSSASPTTTIQDLHADVLVAIFARLGLRDLCTVELGWFCFLAYYFF